MLQVELKIVEVVGPWAMLPNSVREHFGFSWPDPLSRGSFESTASSNTGCWPDTLNKQCTFCALIRFLRASFLWPQTTLSHVTVKTIHNEEPFIKGNNVLKLVPEVRSNRKWWLPIFHLISMHTYFRASCQLLAPQLTLKIWQRCKQLSTWYTWISQASNKSCSTQEYTQHSLAHPNHHVQAMILLKGQEGWRVPGPSKCEMFLLPGVFETLRKVSTSSEKLMKGDGDNK